jgi:hypothetical protein
MGYGARPLRSKCCTWVGIIATWCRDLGKFRKVFPTSLYRAKPASLPCKAVRGEFFAAKLMGDAVNVHYYWDSPLIKL